MFYKTQSTTYPSQLTIPESFFNVVSNMDAAFKETSNNYPPFNLIQIGDNNYRIEVGLSGFKLSELEVIKEGNLLSLKGNPKKKEETEAVKYHHRKLSKRSFKLDFTLGRDVFVEDVYLEDGILFINLKRVIPEEMKPKKFEIFQRPYLEENDSSIINKIEDKVESLSSE